MTFPDVTQQLVNQHFLNYKPYRPDDEEMEAMHKWGDGLDEDILERVLDVESHPKSPNGHRVRPNFGDLKAMANDIRRDRGDFRKQEDQSLLDDEECFYCSGGFISVVVTRDRWWYVAVAGRCGHCQAMGGSRGSSSYKVLEPQDRIIELARQWKVTCPEAADRVVETHLTRIRESDEKASVKGNVTDPLPDYLKGLDEHKGTDASEVPFQGG